MLNFLKQKAKPYFNIEEQKLITEAIKEAEHATSGEVRVYIEANCKYLNALDRAKEVFFMLQMDETLQHNGVLIYLAFKDKQFAIFGDTNIYNKMGKLAFENQAANFKLYLIKNLFVEGFCTTINLMGIALKQFFPNDNKDKNELPDEIVFGN